MSAIKVLAIFTAIMGILAIGWGLIVELGFTMAAVNQMIEGSRWYRFIVTIIPLVMGFCYVITSFGLWYAKKWGFWLATITYGISIIIPLLFWTMWIYVIILSALPAMLLIYLITQKDEFKR